MNAWISEITTEEITHHIALAQRVTDAIARDLAEQRRVGETRDGT